MQSSHDPDWNDDTPLAELQDIGFVHPAQINYIQFGILSSKEVTSMAVCEVTHTKMSGPNSVYDERMGVLENGKLCQTCHKDNKTCIGHFGYIDLNVCLIHPLFYRYVLNILRCVCYKCSGLLTTRDQLEFHGVLKYHKQTRFNKVLKLLEKNDVCLKCHTLQPKYVFSMSEKVIQLIFKMGGGEYRKDVLFDDDVRKIFENMTDDDVALMGFSPGHSHPRNLVLDVLPVLPPVARPFVISDNVVCDDDLTIQYLEILKANIHLKTEATQSNELKRQRHVQSLKFRIRCLFDNNQERSKHSNGRPLKGIKKRLTGKEGQLRNNLMGKRVDKSARTVIGPDPTLKVNEIAVPKEIAEVLTYPVRVTDINKDVLTKMLYENKVNYVIQKGTGLRINMKYALYKQCDKLMFGDYLLKRNGERIFIKNEKQFFLLEEGDRVIRCGKLLKDFRFPLKKTFELEVGDIVERKLRDGDIVLLNRQPSLHAGSMIAFNVRIRPGSTIRTNLATTKSFNADKSRNFL